MMMDYYNAIRDSCSQQVRFFLQLQSIVMSGFGLVYVKRVIAVLSDFVRNKQTKFFSFGFDWKDRSAPHSSTRSLYAPAGGAATQIVRQEANGGCTAQSSRSCTIPVKVQCKEREDRVWLDVLMSHDAQSKRCISYTSHILTTGLHR